MINQPGSETIDSSMTPPPKDVLSYSVSQNPVASELDGDSIDSSIQNALTETASNQSKKTPISIPVQELTPIERAVNEYAKINNARNKTALNQSLVSASAKDPDTAAKSQALATSLNVSTGVVDFDIELAKRQMLLRKAEAIKLAEKYPSLAKMFLNQDFAEIAHDDIDNLAKTSDISRRLIATNNASSDSFPLEFDPIRTANYYATNTLEGFKSDWERGYKSGDINDRSSKLGYSAFTSPGSELRDAYIFQAENLKSKTEEYLGTWTESLAELAGQMAPMTVEAVATGVVASGGTALVTSIFPPAELPAVPSAFAAGFAGSISYQSFEIETGASYLDLRKGDEDYEPMSHEEAAAIAPTIGLINAVLETASNFYFFVPGAKLAKYALKKIVKETVSKSLRKATVGKLARSAAVRVLKTGSLDTATEVLQTTVPKIVREANVPEGRMSAFDTEEGRKRFADEIAVTIEKTFKGAFLLGLLPGGAKFIHERSIHNRSIQQQEEITNHIDNAKESKVNKRSKTTYTSYLAEQLSGESLYIGVDQFEQARRKNGVGLQEVEKIIPGITEQVAKARASGGDVVIPTSLYLSELIDTEFGVSIRNDIRADAEGMSINEIAESQEFLKELKSINKQAVEDFKKTNKDWAESAGKIEEEVFAKIKAAGNYTEEQARMLAQWHRDTAVVLASRFGMTPEQFNAKFGLSIESAYTPEQQAPAQQVVPTAPTNQIQTVTPKSITELSETTAAAQIEVTSAIESNALNERDGKRANESLFAMRSALKSGKIADIAIQTWRAINRNIPQLSKMIAKANELLKKMGVEIVDPTGQIYTDGWVEVEVVAWEPYEEGQESPDEYRVVKTMEPIVRQNGQIIKRGQIIVRDIRPESAMSQTEIEAKQKNQDEIKRRLEEKLSATKSAEQVLHASFEQASRADLGLGQQAAPAPDSGVFDANNPPVSSEAIFALMDADGKIYYDINATMHGDLVETFPDITDTVIDGGFIVNGKYMMGKSDGGYSAFEGEQKQIDAVRNFTEQANTQGFQESNYRPAVVAWAKERFGDRTAPDGSTVWQNFTEWFGDSKVVDAEGKPRVVYHGTQNEKMNEFSKTRPAYFTADKQLADEFADRSYWGEALIEGEVPTTISAYLSIKNPLVITTEKEYESEMMDRASVGHLLDRGYDGIIYNPDDRGSSYFLTVSPTQIKSAVANTGEFSETDPNILRQELSTRRPSGKLATENPITTLLTISHDQTLRTPEVLAKNIATLRRLTPMKWLDDSATPEQQLEYFIEQGVANLEFLYELMPDELRQRARLWYGGGRKMAEWMSDRTGLSVMQSAGVLAVLSPQKDWYENVTLAHRISDIISTQLDFAWDDKMTETSDRFIETIKEAKRKAAEKKKASGKEEDPNSEDSIAMDLLTSLRGKKLSEIINNPMSAAVWVRVFDETHNNKSYSIILPEGGIGETKVTAEGSPSKLRWQNYGAVSRAISIIIDGRAENVFYQIGGQHKVRNFYNNLFAPESDLYATIDTHAVAAALMQPFAGTDEAVGHAFGGSPSSGITGLSGAYSIYMEVYRRAAEKYGILPREMQSITWEAVRGLFEAADKKTLKPKINAVWDRYKRGEIDADQARLEVISIAGGITEPSWAKTSFNDSPAITYSGKSATDTITKLVAEKTSDAVDVLFEVAPDPTNIALSAQWNSLDAQTKHRISAEVAAEIVPNILKEFGVSGEVVAQVGGWEGKTNPGFALRVTSGKLTGQIARALGRTLSQQGMYSISAKPFLGSEVSGVVVITLPAGYTEKQIADLYEKLWKLKRNRKPIIQGHSTIDGKMVIINGTKIATTDFADMIDKHLGGAFEVTDTEAHTAFDSKDTYDTNLQRPASKGSAVLGSERLDRFREQATSLIDTKINEAKSASGLFKQSEVPAAFYSALSVEVNKLTTKSAIADSWKQQIKGLIAKGVIKEREVFWSGLDNWLDLQEGKITKEQVQAFLAAGGVKVKTETLGNQLTLSLAAANIQRMLENAQFGLESYRQPIFDVDAQYALASWQKPGISEKLRLQYEALLNEKLNDAGDHRTVSDYVSDVSETKYQKYQLPDGTNYREVLVTLPRDALGTREIMDGDKVVAIAKNDAFKSSHWDQPNVLVHLRLNDRVDADGKKVLFVEEVQSDWGQQGREKGFVTPIKQEDIDKEETLRNKLLKAKENTSIAKGKVLIEQKRILAKLGLKDYRDIIGAGERRKELTDAYRKLVADDKEYKVAVDKDVLAVIEEVRVSTEYSAAFETTRQTDRVPIAPFVESTSGWLELGLKQIMLEAVNGGYDRVAFVGGDQSVERYRKALTEAVDEVEINKNDDGTYTYSAIRGGVTVQGEQLVSAKRINEVFGKAGSKQLLEQADANPNDIHTISSKDIEIGGEGMRKFYDTVVPQALNKMLKKLGGDKVGEVEIDTRRPEDNAYYADLTEADTMRQQGFTVTPALAAQVNQGLPLFQSAQNKPARGWFDPKQLKAMLGSKSDITTFFHELAHYYLTVYSRVASDPQSPSQVREDMDAILSWFGIAGETPEQRLATWNAMTLEEQRPHHEAFAYNKEIYVSEGKSPSIEMQGVFERFGQFIKRIYISIRDDLNAIYKQEFGTDLPMMTGEIRRVMDRMIATDEQIRSAEERRNMENIFKDQELSGMDDAQWASYQQMRAEATQKSVSELNEQSLAATTWASRLKAKKVKELEAEQEELRSEIRKQVKKEVESRNVYRAIKFLKYGILQTAGGEEVEFTGSNKLNANAVKLMVPKENMDKFGSGKNGMVALDGYHPDIVSERFNYSSGDELILAILDAKPMDEVIDGITEDRMEIENGELNSPQAIEAAADKAVHNEARVKLVAVELRWLTKATQPVRAMIAAAKSVAKQMLETKRLRDIKPGDYASAAARAAKESQTAYFASQSAETAAKTAYTRHYNKMIAEGAEEAKAVEMATKVSDEALAKAESRSEAHKKKYGKMKPSEVAAQAKRSQLLQEQLALEANEALDQVKKSLKYLRNVLSDKNVQKIGADNSDQIALLLERFELKNISLKEMDKRTSLANWIASQLELGLEVDISKELIEQTNKIPYRNLTLSEFNDLVDAVKTIEYMGKNENAILTAAKKAAFKETKDEIVKSIIENAGDRKASTRTAKSGTIDAVIYPIKRFIAAQFKAASVVRILDGGKDDGPLWNYLIRSANKSGDKETTMRATATEAVSKILAPFFKSGRMGGKGKMFNSVNESLNREEKLVIALNMGNEGNIQRMLDGYGWTLEQVIPILESMTTEELNAVQEIWDHFETYKNEISAKSRRIYGKDLDFIEPTPIQIKSASGETVSLRGGYYPAKYDPMASSKAQNLDEAETAKQLLRAAHISATTSRGYSKQRATEVFDQPLIRNLSALYSGLNEVIHDLSWHEWTIDANKLMRDKAFDKEIRNRYGSLFIDQLKSWIQDVAAGDKAMDTGMDIPLNFLRQGISSAGLGFNLQSAVLQITGFNQSIIRVGPKYIGYGIMQVMKRGTGAFREVNELSEFMANRSRTQFRELNELRNRIRGQSAVMKKVRMGTYFLMMKMQRSVDVPTWIGAYAKQLEINPDEQLARDIADQTVIDTQGSGMVKDLSGVERGGAGAKLFTVFYGYMNTVYNMAAVETMTEKKRGKLAAKYVMLFVVPVVLGYAIKQLLRPKKDDDDEFDLVQLSKDLSIEQIQYLMGTMVVAREFSQIAKTMIDPSAPSMGYGGPAGLRMIGDTYTAATQFGQGEFDAAFRKSAINLIGDATGLPSAQVNRTIDGIEALMEDETTDLRAPLFGVRK